MSRSAPFGAPVDMAEVWHREQVLCGVRSIAALCSLGLLYFDRTLVGRYTLTAHLLLLLYLVYSVVTLWLVRVYRDYGQSFLLLVHAADILWPALISLYTAGPNSPFSALFVFGVVAAAYRWGLRETLGTALASVLVFMAETVFVTSDWGRQFDLLRGEFRFSAFVLEIIGILLLGILLGHLAEMEEKFRARALAIKRIIQKADPEGDINETVEEILSGILRLFNADRVVLAMNNPAGPGGFIWNGVRGPEGRGAFHFGELEPPEMARYFFPMPGKSWYLQKSGHDEVCQILTLDAEGLKMERVSCFLPGGLFSQDPFHALMATAFTLRNKWSGRVFLFDLQSTSHLPADLALFQELVREAAPAVHSAYLLRRSRFRARAIERARIARDLHDGVIQSLIALEMQVDVLRRKSAGVSVDAGEKLESVRSLLRDEVIKLRELIQQLKADDAAPRQLVTYIADMACKFQRETGIRTSFASDFDAVALSPRVSREVVQIVHEALTNVRKHSGAHRVQVRLTSEDGFWKLLIEDDGKGFEFSGRLTHENLDAAREGPEVIKERIRSIDGELAIESQPSQGSRLEIRLMPKAYG